jgi:hypothetical protein
MLISYLKEATKALWFSSVVSNQQPQKSLSLNAEIPDGPFSFCDISSRSTDLFDISSISITKQPVYM